MAARRRQTRGSATIQYEDLQPNFEWTEQPAANLLNIHLPDFQKEQLRISYVHSSRKLNVTGDRQVSDNRSIRFSLDFPVPQNCEVSKIQGKFQNGDLIITMPKLVITQPATIEEPPRAAVKEAPKTSENTTPEVKAEKRMEEKRAEEKKGADFRHQKGQDVGPKTALSTADSKMQKDAVNEKKGADFSPQKGQDEAPKTTLSTADSRMQKDATNEKLTTTEAVKEKLMMLEQGESSKKRKESMVTDEGEDMISKKRKESMVTDYAAAGAEKGRQDFKNFSEKVKEVRDAAAAAAKKTVRGAMEMSEERQTMVNMGVSVLAIVAVGAYIVYSNSSSGNLQD